MQQRKLQKRTTNTLTIRIRQFKFIGHKMRKEGLEHLTFTGHTEGKIDSKKTSDQHDEIV